ncbi:MAG: hypothetical protein PV344_06880, partial [Anaplasma sp.]|nr:hypothetical protein [Anaplasma sp.]
MFAFIVVFKRLVSQSTASTPRFVHWCKKGHYQSAEVEDRLMQDRFVVGLLDSCLSDKLCRCPKLRIE